MATILWPLLITMLGLLLYALTNGKVSEAGRLAYFAGLFWVVYLLTARAFHF